MPASACWGLLSLVTPLHPVRAAQNPLLLLSLGRSLTPAEGQVSTDENCAPATPGAAEGTRPGTSPSPPAGYWHLGQSGALPP